MRWVTAGTGHVASGAPALWSAVLAGALIGVGVLHPLTMVIYWFEFHPEFAGADSAWAFVALRVRAGFLPPMWPMSGIFAALGAGLGLLAGWTSRALIRRQRKIEEQSHEPRTLGTLLTICAWCKKIRDDQEYWRPVEGYLVDHDDAQISRSVCPDCAAKLAAEVTEARGGLA